MSIGSSTVGFLSAVLLPRRSSRCSLLEKKEKQNRDRGRKREREEEEKR
jgi:hypothetical protein